MSATDELRRLLDERGVEWSGKESTDVDNMTEWEYGKTKAVAMEERDDDTLGLGATHLTPAQAIAATLGSGTCHNIASTYLDFLCSECGFVHYHSDENDSGDGNEWHYCPNCGRKVVGE